ncbi:hypothetical protein EVAR_56940_1 [Eumeta japonica]|uniref:Uncharacterized protein n=1 Tax=Eumeta variegata TaxID=151549 RepID=A0A4C1YAX0_EUMVA|nr:hypothetical protein EVAR_56940_1 [Eumeta japonica]
MKAATAARLICEIIGGPVPVAWRAPFMGQASRYWERARGRLSARIMRSISAARSRDSARRDTKVYSGRAGARRTADLRRARPLSASAPRRTLLIFFRKESGRRYRCWHCSVFGLIQYRAAVCRTPLSFNI